MRKILSVFLALAAVLCMVLITPVSAVSRYVGDLDANGRITAADVVIIKKLISGTEAIDDQRFADLNLDGRINASDVLLLKQAIAGKYTPPQIDESETADISEYTVVVSSSATEYEQYAAELLCDRVAGISGITLTVADDTSEASGREIIIGETTRTESASSPQLSDNQYAFGKSGDSIILAGKDYMIGGAVAELCSLVSSEGKITLDNLPDEPAATDYAPVEANSVILMIGDGMGPNHIEFTSRYVARQSSWTYNYSGFTAAAFPAKGDCTTVSASDMTSDGRFKAKVTDSAAAATALATGWKTQNKKLGINLFGQNVQNIRELAASAGLKTAVISTEETTGATPAAFTVHNVSRSNIDEISAEQTELINSDAITYLAGNLPGEHQLLEETKKALGIISSDSNGFFAMIEEAYIDKSCDRSYGSTYTRKDTALFVSRFDEAIKYAATFTAAHPGTVLIVTADHETGALSLTGDVTNNGLHTDTPVPVYAMGYGVEQFNGVTTDNVKIGRFMASVFGAESFGIDVPLLTD